MSFTKLSILLSLLVFGLNTKETLACSNQTLESIVKINSYYQSSAGDKMNGILRQLSLCDENLIYAGELVANTFNPYFHVAIQGMTKAIESNASAMSPELAEGIGLYLPSKMNLYYHNQSIHMMRAILFLGKHHPQFAVKFSRELIKKQYDYYERTSGELLKAVNILQSYAVQNRERDIPVRSLWAFRSQNESCESITGPWGRYELCPRYFASTSDKFGNRIMLACKAENSGIELRVSFGRDFWNRLSGVRLQSLAFGTGDFIQSVGVPYIIDRDRALLAEEVLAPEVLFQLENSNELEVRIRGDYGEIDERLKFSLSGYNAALKSLMDVCQ